MHFFRRPGSRQIGYIDPENIFPEGRHGLKAGGRSGQKTEGRSGQKQKPASSESSKIEKFPTVMLHRRFGDNVGDCCVGRGAL